MGAAVEISDSTSATATAANSSGTQIPSLSPLSTLSPWRILAGTRGSVTTACPSAASVGARTTPRITASSIAQLRRRPPPPRRRRARWSVAVRSRAAAPAPRRRDEGAEIDARGIAEQHERERRLRQGSHGRARALEVDPVEHLGPASNPNATNTIAGVIGVPDSRREIAATASRVNATSASDHSI